MNDLGKKAHAFAQQYVALVDAMIHEGVPEETARDEARMATLSILYSEGLGNDEFCPMCGRGTPPDAS